jgi:hypothetical protein
VAAANTITQDLIIDALYTKLKTGDFGTEVGSRVYYHEAPRDNTGKVAVPYPYCVFHVISGTTELDTFDRNSLNMRIQISCFDSETNGPRALGDIVDDLCGLLHRFVPTVAGHEMLPIDLDMRRGPVKDGDAWAAHTDFMLAGWKT